jgi:glycosyltransferase involved in cell wall biosynthesis
MRIAFDHQAFCLQKTGGISRYYCRLAEELLYLKDQSEVDLNIGIFAPLYRNQYLSQAPQKIVHGYAVKNYPPKLQNLFAASNNTVAKHMIKGWCPDLVHETYYSAKRLGPLSCRTVLTVFDMIAELTEPNFKQNPSEFKKTNKYMAVMRADHIICISEHTRKDLIELFEVPANKISVVYLGCDEKKDFSEVPRTQSFERPYLFYVGLREGYKNFNNLLYAVARSPRLKKELDLIAFGGGAFSRAEQALFKELGFDAKQLRHLSGDDKILNRLYSNAAALVYPSIYEGFGLPPLEAMAHFCPVVSSNSSCMPEIIGEAAEFFNPHSVDNMTTAIESVVFSDTRKNELLRLGQERIKLFNWQRCAQETFAFYSRIVRGDT